MLDVHWKQSNMSRYLIHMSDQSILEVLCENLTNIYCRHVLSFLSLLALGLLAIKIYCVEKTVSLPDSMSRAHGPLGTVRL